MVAPPGIVSSLESSTPILPLPLNPTPLVLHIDINETCLVGDEAGGDTREDCLNKMLAKSAFVQMPPGTCREDTSSIEPTHWWDGTPLDGPAPALYTGWKWPEGCCPYYRTSYKKVSKTFCTGHGKSYKAIHDELQDKLTFGHENLPPVLDHMLPALFETLQALTSSKEQHNLACIVFRTFGTDLHEISEAVSLFAKGQHPDYPNYSNDNFVLSTDNLVKGRWNSEGIFELYSWENDNTLVASGDDEILDWFAGRTICGIQDDYKYWSRHDCHPSAGKPIWIPSRDKRQHHVLLDDNIHNLENDSIASVRRQKENGEFCTLSGKEIQQVHGVHLIRVPTVEPILNPQWFLDKINDARARFAAQQRDCSLEN